MSSEYNIIINFYWEVYLLREALYILYYCCHIIRANGVGRKGIITLGNIWTLFVYLFLLIIVIIIIINPLGIIHNG